MTHVVVQLKPRLKTEGIQRCIGSIDLQWGHFPWCLPRTGRFNPMLGLMASQWFAFGRRTPVEAVGQ